MKTNGRATLLFAAIVSAICAGSAFALQSTPLIAGILFAAATLSGLLSLRISHLRINIANQRKNDHTIAKITEVQERISHRTSKIYDIAGTSHGTRSDLRDLTELVKSLDRSDAQPLQPHTSDHCASALNGVEPEPTPRYIRPAVLDAIAPSGATKLSGRLAGAGTNPDAFAQLESAIYKTQDILPRVAAITPPSRIPDDAEFEWCPLDPHLAPTQISRAIPALLFIDCAAFSSGKWTGAKDAAGTQIYASLWEVLLMARAREIPVLLYGDMGPASTFTDEIESYSDIRIRNDSYTIGHATNSSIVTINKLVAAYTLDGSSNPA